MIALEYMSLTDKQDVLLSTDQGVLGHNCYAYCLGNPTVHYDSDGTSAIGIALLGICIAGLISGFFSEASGGNFITGFYSGALTAGMTVTGTAVAGWLGLTGIYMTGATVLSGAFGGYCGYQVDITGNQKEYDGDTAINRTITGAFSGLLSRGFKSIPIKYGSGKSGAFAEVATQFYVTVEQEGLLNGISFVLESIIQKTKKKESNRPKAFSDTAIDMDYIFLDLTRTD